MRSMLNGPSSRSIWSERIEGPNGILDSGNGRDITPSVLLKAVGSRITVTMKPYSTYHVEWVHKKRICLGVLGSPALECAHNSFLSASSIAFARRKGADVPLTNLQRSTLSSTYFGMDMST